MSQVTWIPERDIRWLGQEPQANQQPATKPRLTTIEKATIAGVVISGISLALSLWQLATEGKLS